MTLTETTLETRMERKKEETKRKVLAVGLELFRQQGFDATTMEQIAARADIAKGTLYHYFPVKEAILDEFIKRGFSEQNAGRIQRVRALPDTRARMVLILSELMQGVQAQPVLFEKYFIYRIQQMIALTLDESQNSGLRSLEAEIIALGQASGELRADLPFDVLIGLYEFVFIEVAQRYYRQPQTFDARSAIEQYVDLFMNGARAQT